MNRDEEGLASADEYEQRNDRLSKGFAAVINANSAENASGTPDWLLGQYLVDCLQAYELTLVARAGWHAMHPEVSHPLKNY